MAVNINLPTCVCNHKVLWIRTFFSCWLRGKYYFAGKMFAVIGSKRWRQAPPSWRLVRYLSLAFWRNQHTTQLNIEGMTYRYVIGNDLFWPQIFWNSIWETEIFQPGVTFVCDIFQCCPLDSSRQRSPEPFCGSGIEKFSWILKNRVNCWNWRTNVCLLHCISFIQLQQMLLRSLALNRSLSEQK